MSFTMTDGSRQTRGTDIILHIADDEEEFLQEYRVREVLHRYCGFMATPVYYDVIKEEPEVTRAEGEEETKEEPQDNKGPERINATEALWLKAPKDCTEEEYKQFYRDVFHTFEDPLFYVHLNVDYPFNLKGILYFPKLTNDFGTREGEIKLFSGQVFVADNIKEVIPEFLMLLKGVIDCPDLPLNVSRSFLQNDGYVKRLSAYITRKVADKLTGLFNTERENYQKYWDDIHPFVKYGCMRDAKFFDQVKDTLLFKSTRGQYFTLNEYLAKNEGKVGKKVIYTNDPTRQSASIAMYDAEDIDVIVMDALIDLNFLSFMEYSSGVEGLTFARVDADSDTFTKELSEEEKKLTAYHEAGHAIVARSLPKHMPIHEVTIIPRGRAGGYTMYLPEDDKMFDTKGSMYNHIVSCMGGRVAEKLKLDDISIGASGDIKQATAIAREMVTKYGFSEKLGAVNYGGDEEVFLGNDFTAHKNYSEHTAQEIDDEIKRIIDEAYDQATKILMEHDETLERVAKALLLVETIDGEQFENLYTGKLSAEDLKESVDKADEAKQARNEEEAAEAERIRKEEEARLMEELKKYDVDYMQDDDELKEEEPSEAKVAEKKAADGTEGDFEEENSQQAEEPQKEDEEEHEGKR